MCKVIVITSGKGGVGKTTAVANIGSALACFNQKVALIDTDIGLRNLDVILGLEERITFDIVDVAEGVCDVRQALVSHPNIPTLFMLPAAQTRDKGSVSEEKMREITKSLKSDFDFILIDCPAGIDEGFKSAVAGADDAIVVTNPEVSAVRDADRVIGLLMSADIPAPKLLINKIRPRMVKRGDMMSVKDIIEVLGISLLGLLPDDESIIKAGNIGVPVTGMNTLSSSAYKNVAKRILGANVEFLPIEKQRRHFIFDLVFKKGGASA